LNAQNKDQIEQTKSKQGPKEYLNLKSIIIVLPIFYLSFI